MESGSYTPSTLFCVDEPFRLAHPDLDEEESEYQLSIDAAHDALGQRDHGLVIAVEIKEPGQVRWSEVECLFDCARIDDEPGIDLIWYAPSEIELHIDAWASR